MRLRSVGSIGLVLVVLGSLPATWAAEPTYKAGKFGKGELKYLDGLPVLIVEGTPEEIGAQIGKLTTKPLARLLDFPKAFLKAEGFEPVLPFLVGVSKGMVPQFPADHRKELDALVKSSQLSYDLAVVGNVLPDIKKIGGCSTLIVEAPHSATKGPLFGRNLDYPTLGYLQKYTLVTIYHPRGKHAFVSIGFPGLVGCISGMNDAGLALATLEVYKSKEGSAFNPKGVPYTLGLRRILEECTTVAEAEKLLRSMKRTTLNNLAICDKKSGAVFEVTPKTVVVRRPVRGICPCTNHFCCKELKTGTRCRRFAILEQSRNMDQLKVSDVAKKLDACNLGELTLQTMIFEPATLKLHLAMGKCPSSKLPLKVLEVGPLLKKKPARE
jgi:isopenicillin-N N-acyltransferase-like protein